MKYKKVRSRGSGVKRNLIGSKNKCWTLCTNDVTLYDHKH